MFMIATFLTVRATVSDPAKRAAFDDWYRSEHLADAMKVFGASKAWRFWSDTDPAVHQATYQVASRAVAEAALASAGMKGLIAQFDRAWPGIPRAREIITLVDERDASASMV
jgi:hypothetical protein